MVDQVKDLDPRNQYTATSGQTIFPYTFPIFDKDDLVVIQEGATLTEGTDYTVSGVGDEDGGNVTLTTGATTGDTITIYRDIALERLVDYQDSGDFLASDVNDDFDRQLFMIQQLNRDVQRSLRVSQDDEIASTQIGNLNTRANKLLAFDASGEITYQASTTLSPVADSLVDTVASAKSLNLAIGDYVRTGGYTSFNDGGGALYRVVAGGTGTDDGGSYHDMSNGNQLELIVEDSLLIEVFGAVGDGATDDTTAIQNAFNFIKSNSHATLRSMNKTYITSSTLTITGAAVKIRFHTDSKLKSSVSSGDFAVKITEGLFQNIDIYVQNTDSTGSGILIENAGTGGVDNSLYNLIGGRCQNLGGKAGTKPALGSGSVGVEFGSVAVGDSNYFNHLKAGFRVRGYDTAIRCAADANAQQILSPQIEDYWYGLDLDCDETYISGGFAHFSAGNSASELTNAIYIRSNRTINTIDGFIAEPGAFASAMVIESGANNNYFRVIDNTAYGISDSGYNNGPLNRLNNFSYVYTSLTENTYYQLSKITLGTNNRKASVRIEWDSNNSGTTAHSSGVCELIVSRNNSGTVSVETKHDSLERTGAGTLELRGFEVSGSDIYPVFFVVNNATATSSCVANVKISGSRSLGVIERHSASTSAPSVTVNAENGADSYDKLTVKSSDIFAGAGNPNGSQTGTLGDLYLNTNGGANLTLWVKESGSGTNTGWVAK